jgi:hypothetical protein
MIIQKGKRILSFAKELLKGAVLYPRYFSFRRNLGNFRRWWRSLEPGHTSMSDASPWICFEAIDTLERFLHADMKIFEYGSGGSTLFFSQRCAEVISVEHHREWYHRVNEHCTRNGIGNVRYFLVEPETDPRFNDKHKADPGHYISDDAESKGKHFRRYATSIDAYADESFHVVIVDGRARPSCCAHALPKVKPGGMLVFDNVETEYYGDAVRMLTPDEWDVQKVYGAVPYIKHFSMTLLAVKKKRPVADGMGKNIR